MMPRINEAFARPLHHIDALDLHEHILTQTRDDIRDSNPSRSSSELSTDVSVMDVSSLDNSSSEDFLSIDSDMSTT